jgi:hypothetical protein
MQRVGVSNGDGDLLTTAFVDGENATLVMVNRAATARRVTVTGEHKPWVEMERTGVTEENAVSVAMNDVVVQPGEIVVLSTVKVR